MESQLNTQSTFKSSFSRRSTKSYKKKPSLLDGLLSSVMSNLRNLKIQNMLLNFT